jgi:hypothetical protein
VVPCLEKIENPCFSFLRFQFQMSAASIRIAYKLLHAAALRYKSNSVLMNSRVCVRTSSAVLD